MWIRRIFLWTVLLLTVGAMPSVARTWYVERDGSGEFANIHNAVYACSAGDTIMIGPGRYEDFHPLVAPAWTREVIVAVTKDNLTFIGSGPATTIIGPTVMYETPGLPPMAVASIVDVDAKFLNIGFENAYNCIYWASGRIEIDGCRFEGYNNGVYMFNEGGGVIARSEFNSEESRSHGIGTFSPCGPLTISGCTFSGPGVNENAISINGTQNATIDGCHISSIMGITYAGSSGTISNCTTTDAVDQSVWVTDAGQVEMTGNQFHGNYASLYINGWSVVTGSGNIFTGGTDLATIYIHSQSQVTLNGNHIFKSGDYAAKIGQYFYEIMTNDLTGNYWGSTDPGTVADWIWDYNDDPVTRAYIDFIPIADGLVSTETKSWGDVKAMFR